MSYRDSLHYLASKTEVLELSNDYGGRVAVCPQWSGRVMTSACDGIEGDGFGFLHVDGIEQLPPNETARGVQGTQFLGGEDQFALSPQGGLFSVDDFASKRVPASFTEGAFAVNSSGESHAHISMQRRVTLANRLGTPFTLDVERSVRLLAAGDLEQTFGATLTNALEQDDTSFVAFETFSVLTNRGNPMQRGEGIVAPRIVGMFGANDRTVAVLPFQSECAIRNGVTPHYFGLAPHQRLWTTERSVAVRADGEHRTQVGATYFCAIPFVGAIDFAGGAITLVTWTLPPRASEPYYLVNEPCSADQPHDSSSEPTDDKASDYDSGIYENGDAVRIYASGGMRRTEKFHPRFYQIDTASPAQVLDHGGSLTQRRQTVHVVASGETLQQLAAHFLQCNHNSLLDRVW
ncbi:MAG: DUF6786 family protein [Thermoguttaceae bacterium]